MKKAIYFDMDGTLADFYSQPNWLVNLMAQKTDPYDNAKPLINPADFLSIANTLKERGYQIGIISWLGKMATPEYKERVRESKRNWLQKHFGNIFDIIHLVQYGTPKHQVATIKPSILVDDNEFINKAWRKHGGIAIDAKDITKILQIVPE